MNEAGGGPRMSKVAAWVDGAGPFPLGALALTGVFARGGANIAYGLLCLWGLWGLFRAGGGRKPAPPGRWAAGLLIFALTWLAAALHGGHYAQSLKTLGKLLYLLALPIPVWLALSRRPAALNWLPALWGLGLMAAALMTWREGGFSLGCLRAKAHLGIIELGSVLGQLLPIMAAAFLHHLTLGRKKQSLFFALALAAGGLALAQNCSRQTFLAAPALCLFMVWGYRRRLKGNILALAALIALMVLGLFFAAGGLSRFAGMTGAVGDGQAVSGDDGGGDGGSGDGGTGRLFSGYSERVRLAMWRLGLEIFKERPLLGVGPNAIILTPPPPLEGLEGPARHAHQTFINVLAETGLAGFIGFLALHLAPLSLLWPRRHSGDPAVFFWVQAAWAVNLQFLLNGLTDQIFGLKPFMYIHWTVVAAALWQIRARD